MNTACIDREWNPNMPHEQLTAGIKGQLAPELGVLRWVDASGQPMAAYGLAQMPGAYKLVFCFQDACPDCHRTGFPTLARMVEAFGGSRVMSFAAVQTVFEDFEVNTYERMLSFTGGGM
ncbi:MAG: hypothetical protein OEL91_08050 [Burkholderiaceae bacterium]|nr:hypothetical protein [Burkholderiaceae bacterium]